MKSIILLSGGLDATVMLALALSLQRECLALTFDYSDSLQGELKAAEAVADFYKVFFKKIFLDRRTFSFFSAKEDSPQQKSISEWSSYLPGRNTIFLSYALAQAELYEAKEIYIGARAFQGKSYPESRPEYFQAFQQVVNLATKQAIKGIAPRIMTPFLSWDKASIVRKGKILGAPLDLTLSCCYPTKEGTPCFLCSSCLSREQALRIVSEENQVDLTINCSPLRRIEK